MDKAKPMHSYRGGVFGKALFLKLTILFFGIVLTAVSMASCANGSSDTGGTTIPTIHPDEQWVNEAISKAGAAPTFIVGTGKTITLSGDGLTWTSNNTAIINVAGSPSGAYDVTPPEGKADVTLTAKAKKGAFSKERKFTVVVHKDSSTVTVADLIKSINLPSETETDINLPATIPGVSGASITWTSDKPSVIADDGKIDPEKRDLRDIPVKLTATLTYNGTATKDFTVALKRLTEISETRTKDGNTTTTKWIFTDTEIWYTRTQTSSSETNTYGRKFIYQDIDTTTKKLKMLRQTHDMLNGKSYEIGSSEHKALAINSGMSEAEYAEYVNRNKTPRLCTYSIRYHTTEKTYVFYIKETYDSSKKWFEQSGSYRYDTSPYKYIRIEKEMGSDYRFSYDDKSYVGTINAEGTVFTGKEKDNNADTITVDITDNLDGTVSIRVAGSTYTLYFYGRYL
ncbi:immunoglobulin-like domain-containing protein [Treponema sp. Marseille-Q4130]|uniref:immunoglobulin-like domain-containing protein n=1 Tax=Treponema sp. Marseille-Q4130 TaxID=2766702 RepID=UPI001651DC58|nr:immunoglobulin-like domain-containing protein [Treponema sp. Marseille-Q4130]MBC6720589.1 hypothetical protein [Treponema sp. Marseille-Q4130]